MTVFWATESRTKSSTGGKLLTCGSQETGSPEGLGTAHTFPKQPPQPLTYIEAETAGYCSSIPRLLLSAPPLCPGTLTYLNHFRGSLPTLNSGYALCWIASAVNLTFLGRRILNWWWGRGPLLDWPVAMSTRFVLTVL